MSDLKEIKIKIYFKFLGFFYKSKTYRKFDNKFAGTFENLENKNIIFKYDNKRKFLIITRNEIDDKLTINSLIKLIANKFLKKFKEMDLNKVSSVFRLYYRNFIGMNGKSIDGNLDIFSGLEINKNANDCTPNLVLNMDYYKNFKSELNVLVYFRNDIFCCVTIDNVSGEKSKKWIIDKCIKIIRNGDKSKIKNEYNLESIVKLTKIKYFFVVDDKKCFRNDFFNKNYGGLKGYVPCILPDGWSYVISSYDMGKSLESDSETFFKKFDDPQISTSEKKDDSNVEIPYTESIDKKFNEIICILKNDNCIKYLSEDEAINELKNEVIIYTPTFDVSGNPNYEKFVENDSIKVKENKGYKLNEILVNDINSEKKFESILFFSHEDKSISVFDLLNTSLENKKIFIFEENIEYIKKILKYFIDNGETGFSLNLNFKDILSKIRSKIKNKIYLVKEGNIKNSLDILKKFCTFIKPDDLKVTFSEIINKRLNEVVDILRNEKIIEILTENNAINELKDESEIYAASMDISKYSSIIINDSILVKKNDGYKLNKVVVYSNTEKDIKTILIFSNEDKFTNSFYQSNKDFKGKKIFIFKKNDVYIKKFLTFLINPATDLKLTFKDFLNKIKDNLNNKIYLIEEGDMNSSISFLQKFATFPAPDPPKKK